MKLKRELRDRPWEIDVDKSSNTEQLSMWISDVRRKKQKCYSSPKRDFRMEAVLTHTLNKAEYELRAKQLSRMHRWRRLRKELLKNVEYGTCGSYNAAEREIERRDAYLASKKDPWEEPDLYQDLHGLDNFLQQLGQIKSVVQRKKKASCSRVKTSESIVDRVIHPNINQPLVNVSRLKTSPNFSQHQIDTLRHNLNYYT